METAKRTLFVVACVLLLAGCARAPIACTMEAKLCPDGTAVGRSGPNCEFAPCPEPLPCDANNQCPEGTACYLLPNEDTPKCYAGDPCITACGGASCRLAESYPPQVLCG